MRRSRIDVNTSARTAAPASKVSSPQMPHILQCSRCLLARAAEPAFQQGVYGIDAVDPANLLALVDPTRVVGNRHLDDGVSGQQQLGGQLRLEVKADAPQFDALER